MAHLLLRCEAQAPVVEHEGLASVEALARGQHLGEGPRALPEHRDRLAQDLLLDELEGTSRLEQRILGPAQGRASL